MLKTKAQLDVGLYLFAVITSMAISLWSVYADPIINIDGILYLQAAEAFTRGDIDLAMSYHKWPLYSLLISMVHQITGLGLETSAHIINGIFNALSCIAFVLLVKELGGNLAGVWIAALVITLFPGLNEIRSYIIRDHAYVAFYLFSLYFLIRALHIRNKAMMLASMISMAVATLFRIEGVVFLVAMPIIYLNSRTHVKPLSRVNFYLLILLTSVILVFIFGWWLYNPGPASSGATISIENIKSGWEQGGDYLDNKIEILKEHIINSSSDTTGRLVYLWTAFGIIFAQVLIILSIPYAYLVWYGYSRDLFCPSLHGIKPWKLFLLFNFIILAVFTLTKFFLTDRYPLALAITLLLTVPFALEHIYNRWRSKPRNTFKSNFGYVLVALLLAVNVYEGLTSISDKHYLKESGLWLKSNLPQGTKLYTDNQLVGFYSDTPKQDLKVVTEKSDLINQFYRGEWILYDYLALEIKPDPEYQYHLDKTLWVVPEKVIKGERQREIRIYNIKKYREREDQ